MKSPKVRATVIDARGYLLRMVVPDSRAFALRKLWLATREDHDPLKQRRDRAQADLIAALIGSRLRHLRFDDPALGALPLALREQAATLVPPPPEPSTGLEPDW